VLLLVGEKKVSQGPEVPMVLVVIVEPHNRKLVTMVEAEMVPVKAVELALVQMVVLMWGGPVALVA
jgi:hypothetical protein